MKAKKQYEEEKLPVLIAIIIITILQVSESCQNPTSTSIINYKVKIQIDTVSIDQIYNIRDSLHFYINLERDWGFELDTLRADSLADWFAQSEYKIEDMWFPAIDIPFCLMPFSTYNAVIVKSMQTNKHIDTLGFYHIFPIIPCFSIWKHYKYDWFTEDYSKKSKIY